MESFLLEPTTYGSFGPLDGYGSYTGAISGKLFFETPFPERNPSKKRWERTVAPPALVARSQFLLRLYVRAPDLQSQREPVFERHGGRGGAGRN